MCLCMFIDFTSVLWFSVYYFLPLVLWRVVRRLEWHQAFSAVARG